MGAICPGGGALAGNMMLESSQVAPVDFSIERIHSFNSNLSDAKIDLSRGRTLIKESGTF